MDILKNSGKTLAAMLLGLTTVSFAQQPEAVAEKIPSARAVAQYVADNGFSSGFSKDLTWFVSGQESEGMYAAYSAAFDFKKQKLYLCENLYVKKDEVIATCVTDKGLDNIAGACFVGQVHESDSLHHVMFRDFDPDYAMSLLTERKFKEDEDARQYCSSAYERIRKSIIPSENQVPDVNNSK